MATINDVYDVATLAYKIPDTPPNHDLSDEHEQEELQRGHDETETLIEFDEVEIVELRPLLWPFLEISTTTTPE